MNAFVEVVPAEFRLIVTSQLVGLHSITT